MITQAIKRWLHKMFAWWPWKTASETDVVPVTTPIHRGVTQDFRDAHNANNAIPWPPTEGVVPQSGITPLIFGQSETTRSTIGEWPERVAQSSPSANEKAEPPLPSPSANPSVEQTISSGTSNLSTEAKVISSDVPATPTPEQQMEFLAYLVRRGLVNEGFPEGQVPEQYRKE